MHLDVECYTTAQNMSPESYEKIWKDNFIVPGISSLV